MALVFAYFCSLIQILCSWLSYLFTVEGLLVLPDGCLLCFLLFWIFTSSKLSKSLLEHQDCIFIFLRLLLKKSRRSERHKWKTFHDLSLGEDRIPRPWKVTEIWINSTLESIDSKMNNVIYVDFLSLCSWSLNWVL